ncbi:hypothetical protein SETIT_9G427200v2 [Setaria italica]|uniref:Uncharacterized protein n=1 Tax=Setaria italica TaxID=4555 RepID=K4AMZ2_SETIT|nr:hypothetical protein SETIT_9G427200v2 [Setaria italica]
MLSRQVHLRQNAANFTARSPVHFIIHTIRTWRTTTPQNCKAIKGVRKRDRICGPQGSCLRFSSRKKDLRSQRLCHHGTHRRTGSSTRIKTAEESNRKPGEETFFAGVSWRMLFAAPHGGK